ncbi:hypothetical protein J6590_039940 [Homalodisca vitripennis]|nr:hypothetical protein J6590_039940 [Homalodisca vitripennis]
MKNADYRRVSYTKVWSCAVCGKVQSILTSLVLHHLCLCHPYCLSSQVVELLLFCMMQKGTVNTHVASHITATSVCVIPTICPPKLGVVVHLSKGTIYTHVPSHITATSVCVIPTICPPKLWSFCSARCRMGQSIHTSQVILPPPLFMLSLLFVLPSCGVVVVLHDAERDSQYTRPKSYYRHLCLCYPYYLSSQVVELLLFWMMQKGTVNTHVASHITATSVCVIPTICPPKLGVVVQLSKGTIYTHIPSHITATSVCVIPTICPPKLWSCCSTRCRMGQSIHTSQVILPPPLFVLSLLFVLPSWELLCSCRKEQSIHTSQVILPPPLFVLSLLFVLPSCGVVVLHDALRDNQYTRPKSYYRHLCLCYPYYLSSQVGSCCAVVERNNQYPRPKSYYRHLCLCYPYYLSSQVGSCCAVVERNNQYPRPKSYYRHLCLCYPYYLNSQVGSCCAVVERNNLYPRPKSYYRHLCLCYPYYFSSQIVELLFCMMQQGTVNTHVPSHITATSVCVIPTICPPKLGVVVQLSKGTINTHVPSHITATSVCVIPTICPLKLWSCCSA